MNAYQHVLSYICIRRYAASVILQVTYGWRANTGREPAIVAMFALMDKFLSSSNPGANVVDSIPVLDGLPDILAPWRKDALKQRAFNQKTYLGLVNDVKDKLQSGGLTDTDCFAATLCDQHEKLGLDDLDIAYLAGSMFEAGSDTTASALKTFVLAICAYPDQLRQAQVEVDMVCQGRSPTFEDFEQLAFIRALVKETLRWRTVTAGGLPHLSIMEQDDAYKGFRIPARATIIPNHWAMCQNLATYSNPLIFDATRWLSADQTDLTEGHPSFGFGRRICPGSHLAVRSLFIVIAHLVANFDITSNKPLDTMNYSSGFNIEPHPFTCKIVPRSALKAKIIHAEAKDARESITA